MDRIVFDLYIESQLAPMLSRGDVVILDNLSVHKSGPSANAALECCFSRNTLPA